MGHLPNIQMVLGSISSITHPPKQKTKKTSKTPNHYFLGAGDAVQTVEDLPSVRQGLGLVLTPHRLAQ